MNVGEAKRTRMEAVAIEKEVCIDKIKKAEGAGECIHTIHMSGR